MLRNVNYNQWINEICEYPNQIMEVEYNVFHVKIGAFNQPKYANCAWLNILL